MKTKTSKLVLLATICFALVAISGFARLQDDDTDSERTVTVMTRNLYLGGDLTKIVQDVTLQVPPEVLFTDTGALFAAAKATDFRARAALIAREVTKASPDLIGLQEVELWRTQCPSDFVPNNAEEIEIDYLSILMDALAERGLHYEVVAVFQGFDGELPAFTDKGLCDIRMTDRGVILARSDASRSVLRLSNVQTGNYASVCPRAIPFPRGWMSVDVKSKGKSFRFISTHLETEDCPATQLAQAAELLGGPARTSLPVILAGDFNSDANRGPSPTSTPTYPALIEAGFTDAWSSINAEAVFTCCHAADLLNSTPFSLQQTRIDLVLTRGNFEAMNVIRLGAEGADRTASGLWASDHAGIAATLVFH